ncbi:MAG: phosphoribosylaminoimidazolesuccinocarboxamide synthase, partial [Alphaproteobacteria bacterium]
LKPSEPRPRPPQVPHAGFGQDAKTGEKMDKHRFRRYLGKVEEGYQEVARRLGILPEAGVRDMKGPEAIQ